MRLSRHRDHRREPCLPCHLCLLPWPLASLTPLPAVIRRRAARCRRGCWTRWRGSLIRETRAGCGMTGPGTGGGGLRDPGRRPVVRGDRGMGRRRRTKVAGRAGPARSGPGPGHHLAGADRRGPGRPGPGPRLAGHGPARGPPGTGPAAGTGGGRQDPAAPGPARISRRTCWRVWITALARSAPRSRRTGKRTRSPCWRACWTRSPICTGP